VDFDSGNLPLTDRNWQCDARKEREVDVDIAGFGCERGKPVRDGRPCFADGLEMVE
jgi:hypothetical protein